ncbi:MAG: DNA alkylation repair protein [Dehalococcoidia bacterium]
MRQQHRPAGPPAPAVDPAQVEQLVDDVRKRLTQAGRQDVAVQLKRAWGPDLPCYGVKAADVHRIGLESVRRMRTGGIALALEFADPLMKSGYLEEGLVAAQVIGASARLITGGDFERVDPWAEALTNGQAADALATSFVAHALAAKPSLVLKLQEWAKSPNPWRRRAAVAAFGPLVREGRFLTDALDVAALLVTDDHPDVQAAVGSMLMEASRLKAPRVVEFLTQWKDKAPRPLLQAAATKLSPQDREAILGR